ncbi:spore germination protein [Bacillota bacterium]
MGKEKGTNQKQNLKLVEEIRQQLPLKESFDVTERNISIGGKEAYIYFTAGFVKDQLLQLMITDFQNISSHDMNDMKTSGDFIKRKVPFAQLEEVYTARMASIRVLAGMTAIVVEGFNSIILMDLREYPSRSVEEPDKEKSLRGARDGFVETLISNTALIRRRIRDPDLVFHMMSVGQSSRTDVCLGYMKGLAKESVVKEIIGKISGIRIDTLTVGDQSLVEALDKKHWLNPFPKIRYTERPDVVAAHITEGSFVILVDNSPTAIILPTGFFDFLQDADDFYFPVITGSYLRMVRNITMLVSVFVTPIYLLVDRGIVAFPDQWGFLMPQESYPIPLFWQFIILEIAVDGLKLASLNTPSSLGMSLSVIGALLLGELSITAGWFIPQSILLMAIIALAAFSQPSMELSYAFKFIRVLLLIGVALLGLWGFLGMLAINAVIMATTKTLTKTSYLYPLIPFNGKKLARLIFRTNK